MAETALRVSERQFRALVSASHHSVYRMSADGRQRYQLDGHDIVGDKMKPDHDWITRYVPAEDRASVLAAVEEAVRTESLFELEHRVRRADGGVAWVLSRAVPILGSDGKVMEWFGTSSDIATRQEAEDAVRTNE